MKVNLGFTPDYALSSPEVASPKKGDKTKPPVYYPHFSIEGKAADKLIDDVSVGETVTATVTMKVTRVSQRVKSREQYSGMGGDNSTIEFEVTNIDIDGADGADSGESAETAVDSYLSGKPANSDGMGEEEDEDA